MPETKKAEQLNTETDKPREYFDAAVYFAFTIARLKNIKMSEAVDSFTGLGREVTGMMKDDWEEVQQSQLWNELKEKLNQNSDPDKMTDLIFEKYKQQEHSKYDPESSKGYKRFGSIGYDYQEDSHTVRIHFLPERSNVSALSRQFKQDRGIDFKKLLEEVKIEHPDAAFVKSSTWLQNYLNYKDLFPQRFQQRLKNIGASSYIGIWGQFQKGNGEGNIERLNEFKNKLDKSKTVEEAHEAFPFKVLEATGPISDFYEKYEI